MSLASGTRFGSCEVIELLAAGGMGEVYRARDIRLDREVAIKVLPDHFAFDRRSIDRFESEARILASVNHPNIAVLYGIDRSTSLQALLLELVTGETLADVLAARRQKRFGLAVEESLAIAEQITAALEAAHDHGVIHRDLKPSNVVLRSDGVIKLLDFGLAKTFDRKFGRVEAQANALTADFVSSSPAGTIAYMSPEQLRGLPADSRADVWAFGCLLYELLAGRRAFDGESSAEVIAKVLECQPDAEALPPDCGPIVRRLLRRCLEKDPRDRLRSIGDAGLEVKEARALLPSRLPQSGSRFDWKRPPGRRLLPWVAGTCIGAGLAGVASLWMAWQAPVAESRAVGRTAIVHAALGRINVGEADRMLAVTPDGSRVIVVGDEGTKLFVRPLDDLEAVSIVSTKLGVRGPFISPDGRWVGYVESNTMLKRVPISGGTPVPVVTVDGPSRGASWTEDGRIIFATSNKATGLASVPAFGGAVTVLTRPDRDQDEADHVFPELLPGGRALLMTILPLSGRLNEARLAVLNLRTGAWRTIVQGGYYGHYLESGHLAYVTDGKLHAIAFDLADLDVRGAPLKMASTLAVAAEHGFAQLDVAANGTLAYLDAPYPSDETFVWVDRRGRETPVPGIPPGRYSAPKLSPDGTRLAASVRSQDSDIWIWDLERETPGRITFGTDADGWPIWVSNEDLVFTSQRGAGLGQIFRQSADGRGVARQVTSGMASLIATGSTPDGSSVILSRLPAPGPEVGWALRILRLPDASSEEIASGEPQLRRLDGVDGLSNDRHGTISPDGRWIAYDSDGLGKQLEIFVRPFPDTDAGVWQVSAGGGQQPHWSADGRELFYLALDGAMMTVPIGGGVEDATTLRAGGATRLFAGDYVIRGGGHIGRYYDVSADGQRFLMIKPGADSHALAQIVVVQNWSEELNRLVPIRQPGR